MLTAEQIEIRRTGLTATNIRDVFLGKAHRVYQEKLGIAPPVEETRAMRAGKHLEAGVAAWAAEELGLELAGDGRETIRHTPIEWALATPDRWIIEGGARRGVVECKEVGRFMVRHWRTEATSGLDSVPVPVALQVAWQLSVTGMPRAIVAAQVGQTDIVLREITAAECERLLARMWEVAEDFWRNNVLARVAPELDGTEDAQRYLEGLYPKNEIGDFLAADAAAEELARQYMRADAAEKAAAAAKAELRQRLCDRVGLHDGIEGEGWRLTWRLRRGYERRALPAKQIEPKRIPRFTAFGMDDSSTEETT